MRLPQKGIDIALPVARSRGFVIFCRHYDGYIFDLVNAEIGRTSIVHRVRTRRLNDTVAGMAGQSGTALAGLCRVPRYPGRNLEIRAAGYYGNLRFFRVLGPGIAEISRNGAQLDPAALAGGAGKNPLPGKNRVPWPEGKKLAGSLKGEVSAAGGDGGAGLILPFPQSVGVPFR
jgi:hypothetical protein